MLVHPVTQCIDVFLGYFAHHLQSIEAGSGPFQLKLFDHIRFGFSGHACNANPGSVHYPVFPQIIWLCHARADGRHNDLPAIYFFDGHKWHHSGFTGIKNTVGDGIHLLEYLIIGKAGHIPRLVLNAKDNLTAGSIGKGNRSFQILFLFRWDVLLIFNCFMLALFQFFKRHFCPPLPQEQAARPLPGVECAVSRHNQ